MKVFHKEMMILAVALLYLLSGSQGGHVDAAKALTLLREDLALGVPGWTRRGCQGADPPTVDILNSPNSPVSSIETTGPPP